MKKANVVIENETGLHARPATELAKLAMKYKCTINLIVNGKLIDKITTYDEYLESDEMARKRQVYTASAEDDND